MTKSKVFIRLAVGLALLLSLLLFFLLLYPYHLRHREQTMLFMQNTDWIRTTYLTLTKGGIVRLCGDWLQQWFYYLGAGPVIVSLLLLGVGIVWQRIVQQLFQLIWHISTPLGWQRFLSVLIALLVMLWETGRECLPEYPVASTLQFLGWSAIVLLILRIRGLLTRVVVIVIGVILGCWMLDISPLPQSKMWGIPNLEMEHQLAIDVEASFGHWDKVQAMTAQREELYNIDIYYHNLCLAKRGQLADSLLYYPQNGVNGLFIPVNEEGNYFLFSAAGEAWWAVGDMTMAEHATLLGLIFSPRHTGSRNLRRLAEINQANGDTLAAHKYLRLLQQSPVHGRWASQLSTLHSPLSTLHSPDTLRLQGEVQLCLRGLLDANPQNEIARQYLLCYDLLSQDLFSFASDVERYGCSAGVRLFEEAMLVVMASRPEMRPVLQSLVREEVYQDFLAFNQALSQSNGNLKSLKARYATSYWYYLKSHSSSQS